MKKYNYILIFFLIITNVYARPISNVNGNWSYGKDLGNNLKHSFIIQQVSLSSNNVSTFFSSRGIINRDFSNNSSPGFQWLNGSGKFACFATGMCIATKINGILTEASASYSGEFLPGYIDNTTGIPNVIKNSDFKVYKVNSTDSAGNNPDYANWYKMVPFGAPFNDINNNGIYDNGIDKPGIKNAAATVFVCLTDGFPSNHFVTEGFGGGTAPVFSEVRITAWDYTGSGMQDVEFVKWEIINKNIVSWDSTYFGIVADPDLGDATDDYIGCDSLLNLGFCYNGDNNDGSGSGNSYGTNPPAFGIDILKGPIIKNISPNVSLYMTIFDHYTHNSPVVCERQPNPYAQGAYNYLRGFKEDGTPWVNPLNMQTTKICYSGDPESGTGWTEFRGHVENCDGSLTGTIVPVNYVGDRHSMMSSGSDRLTVQPNDTQTVVIAQMMARGSSNLNSVTKLKQLDATVQTFYDNGMIVSVLNTNSEIPASFSLFQNYPNPFNPSTNIKFDLVRNGFVTLKIYDVSGKEIATLINNEYISVGTNEVNFNAANLASGIYFYTLTAGTFTDTKRMVLIK